MGATDSAAGLQRLIDDWGYGCCLGRVDITAWAADLLDNTGVHQRPEVLEEQPRVEV